MLRNLGVCIALIVLVSSPVHSDVEPLNIEKTEPITEWEYEMAGWWGPFVVGNELWLVYEELATETEGTLKYKTYTDEWSSPQVLANMGDFITVVEDDGTLFFFWNTEVSGESEMLKDICFKTLGDTWSQPFCSRAEPYIGDQFVATPSEGEIWLVWSRYGFWEYQVFQGDHWDEPRMLTSTEEYEKILKVFPFENEIWIFYETGTSDIFYRVANKNGISEPYQLITEGFPYLYDVVQHGDTLMVFLEVRGVETERKTLVYTAYDGEWTPMQAVGSPEEGFLSGGAAVTMSDGRTFVFWNGTDDVTVEPWEVDIFYRVYDGSWSHVYRLTDTPDVWETAMTVAEYSGKLIIIWREKESKIVYASHVYTGGESEAEQPGELQKVTPKEEPEKPEKRPPLLFTVKKYLNLIVVVCAVAALSGVYIVKKRMSSEEKVEEVRLGERRKTKKPERKRR